MSRICDRLIVKGLSVFKDKVQRIRQFLMKLKFPVTQRITTVGVLSSATAGLERRVIVMIPARNTQNYSVMQKRLFL